MAHSSKNYIVLSSDSESSVNENNGNFQQTTKTGPKRKRLRTLHDYFFEVNQQYTTVRGNSLHSKDIISSDSIHNNLNQTINNDPNNSNFIIENFNRITNNDIDEINSNNEDVSNVRNENLNLNEESNSNISTIVLNDSNAPMIQTSIDQYFPSSENSFQEINNLNEHSVNFRIRCKIIHKSSIKYFNTNKKVFDAIVCDRTAEIKVVAFDDRVDQFYDLIAINKMIIIENGSIKPVNPNYATPYCMHQITLLPNTNIQPYSCSNFKPTIKMVKQSLRHIMESLHGTIVDVEAIIVMEQPEMTSTSQSNGQIIRRKSIKIKDEKCAIYVTFWNNKIDEIPQDIVKKTIRIRGGKINHWNDYITISITEKTIVQFD